MVTRNGVEEEATSLQHLSQSERLSQLARMNQRLLQERFGFHAHMETRNVQQNVLYQVKSGSKLRTTTYDKPPVMLTSRGHIESHAVPVEALCYLLSRLAEVAGPVADRTQLSGKFDMDLRWHAADEDTSASSISAGDEYPALRRALVEQLGLELKRETVAAHVLVVDTLEHPTAN